MAQTTFSNGRGIAHKGSSGKSIVFPDVCKTPVGPSIVPIPYPNLGQSSDTSRGPKSVKVDGQMPMVKGAKYGVRQGHWKYIEAKDEASYELYDLATDPAELTNLFRASPRQATALAPGSP